MPLGATLTNAQGEKWLRFRYEGKVVLGIRTCEGVKPGRGCVDSWFLNVSILPSSVSHRLCDARY